MSVKEIPPKFFIERLKELDENNMDRLDLIMGIRETTGMLMNMCTAWNSIMNNNLINKFSRGELLEYIVFMKKTCKAVVDMTEDFNTKANKYTGAVLKESGVV